MWRSFPKENIRHFTQVVCPDAEIFPNSSRTQEKQPVREHYVPRASKRDFSYSSQGLCRLRDGCVLPSETRNCTLLKLSAVQKKWHSVIYNTTFRITAHLWRRSLPLSKLGRALWLSRCPVYTKLYPFTVENRQPTSLIPGLNIRSLHSFTRSEEFMSPFFFMGYHGGNVERDRVGRKEFRPSSRGFARHVLYHST